MTPKNKLFIGILAFMLIVNILIIFNLNQFYIRAILAFIFLITIPGLLIMLCLKIRNINPWEYLVYTVGLSVAFIMFAGLAVNWILPFLNITDKPLSLYPILICFDTFLLVLWLIAQRRNEDNVHLLIFPFNEYKREGRKLSFIPKLSKFTGLDRIFMIIPFFFPFMAVIGAFLLNNHGTNVVTMVMLGAIAVYVFLVVLFRDKLNENVFPWALWMIGLALLLSFSMRSWYVSGSDTNEEYSIFQMTKEKAFWSISNFIHAFNAMLSLTILPTILSIFCRINPQYIQKLFFSIIFNFVPLIVYIISRKFFDKNISFFAGLFFVFQSGFMNWNWIPSRQQIAFLFFGLMLLVLFTKEINSKIRNLLFVIFGFSMIVSHYSTSYIALAIFLLTYLLILICKLYENRKIKKGKLKLEDKRKFYLTGVLILLLLVFGFLWYSQLSNVASGPINFMRESFSNLGRMFEEEVQAEGVSPLDQFNIFYKKTDVVSLIKEYEESIPSNLTNTYSNTMYKLYPKYPSGIKSVFNQSVNLFIIYFRESLKVLGKIFIILGIFYLFIKRKNYNLNFIILNISCFSILAFLLVLPFISIQYDVIRTYQQILILLSIIAIFWAPTIFKRIPKINSEIFISIFLIFYFLALSGVFYQISGGTGASMRLNNIGFEYGSYYVHQTEEKSGIWMSSYIGKNVIINADGGANTRIRLIASSFPSFSIVKEVHPKKIVKNSYVYLTYQNKIEGLSFKSYNGKSFSFNFPTEFLNDNKNKIYNNGGSEIFK